MSFRRRLILGSLDAIIDLTKNNKVDFGSADLVGSGWSISDGVFTGAGGGDDFIYSTSESWSSSNTNYAAAKIDFSAAADVAIGDQEPLIQIDGYTQIQKLNFSGPSHGWRITSQTGVVVEVNSDNNEGAGDRFLVTNNGSEEFYTGYAAGSGAITYSKRLVQSDVGFRVSSSDGISTTKVFDDNAGNTHTVVVTGGIITSWTVV